MPAGYTRSGGTYAYSVSEVETRGDGEAVVSVVTELGGVQRMLVTRDGLFELAGAGAPRRVVSSHPGAGWTIRLSMPDPGPAELLRRREVKAKYTTHQVERVRTPAGTFDALRVEMTFDLAGRTQRNTSWYAREIGLVKSTDGGGNPVFVLKSFTHGKK